jgi:hypothetical protein
MDYSELAFWLGIGILIYFALLKLLPSAARFWFCLGGGLVGAYILALLEVLLFHAIFPDNAWVRIGAAIWIGPIFAVTGALTGFWLAHRWTELPKANQTQSPPS